MKFPKNPVEECEKPWNGSPNPILYAYSTQTMRTTEKAVMLSIMLLIDQRFCMTPPYSTTSPGRLINPTSVAAVICHDVSPALSQPGASRGMQLLRSLDADPQSERRLGPRPKDTPGDSWSSGQGAIASRPAISRWLWTYG